MKNHKCYCCQEEKECDVLAASNGPWSTAICAKCKWHDWDRLLPGLRDFDDGPLCTPPKYIAAIKGVSIQYVFGSQEALDKFVSEHGDMVSRTFCTGD